MRIDNLVEETIRSKIVLSVWNPVWDAIWDSADFIINQSISRRNLFVLVEFQRHIQNSFHFSINNLNP